MSHWDADLKGFGVRVSPAGAKTFTLKYRLDSGRVRWKTLGRVGKIALEKARRHAKDDIGIVARGGDPLSAKDAARGAFTVATVAEKFLEDYVTPRKKASTLRLYRLAIDSHITPRLGAVPIAEVSHEDAVKLHDRLRATPILANRVLAVLSKLLAWSMTKARYRPAGANPCHGIEKYEERRRKRYLDAAEYARLGQGAAHGGDPAGTAHGDRAAPADGRAAAGDRDAAVGARRSAWRRAASARLEDRREDRPPVAAGGEAAEALAAVRELAVRVPWHRPTRRRARISTPRRWRMSGPTCGRRRSSRTCGSTMPAGIRSRPWPSLSTG